MSFLPAKHAKYRQKEAKPFSRYFAGFAGNVFWYAIAYPLADASGFDLAPMAVYVDNLRDYGWRHGPSCHLIADSVEELINFAISIGLRREWFQPRSSPHFDLTAEGRKLAVEAGAIEISQRDLVKKLRELREARNGREN